MAQIRTRPATAAPIPTARRIGSGVAIALFIARRIQVGLAANSNPSITNRMPTPMRNSANAMDLIGLEPPPFHLSLGCQRRSRSLARLLIVVTQAIAPGVPVLTFVSYSDRLFYECQNPRDTSKYLILVWL